MNISKRSTAILCCIGVICILGIVSYFNSRVAQNFLSNETISPAQNISTGSGIKLLISLPKEGVSVVHGTKIYWDFTDPSIKDKYPSDNTFVVLDVISSDNTKVGSIGDGFKLKETSAQWNTLYYVTEGFYKINPGEQYKIRATLQYQPAHFTCDPAFGGECRPAYSPADQALIDQAKQYQGESALFTFDFTGSGYGPKEKKPAGTPDSAYSLPKRVYISENPNTTRPEKDWIGVVIDYGGISASSVRLDLSGWSIQSTVSGKSFKLEGILGNGWDALIIHTKAATPDSPESSRAVGGEVHLNLGAETVAWSVHDTIQLLNPEGVVVDTYTY